MAKNSKDEKNQKQEQAPLTEWQKRNLDFLKQKEKEKKEQEKLKKELADKKRARLLAKSSEEDESEDEKSPKKKKSKSGKASSKKKSRLGKKASVKPLPKKKKTKPKSTKFKRRMTSVLVPALLGVLLALYLLTPLSKIKHVTVDGVNRTTSQSVLKASGLKDSDYTLATIFNRSRLANAVAKNDIWVKSASVDYSFPFTFSIKVKEYSIVAYAQTDQGYVPILESGTRLDSVEATDFPDKFTTINLKNGKYLSSLIKKLTKMDKSLISEIKVITLADSKTTPDLLNLEMQDGNTVRVPLSQIDKKLPYYDKIKGSLKDNKIVDMEVGIFATSDNGQSTDDSSEASSTEDSSQSSDQNQDNQNQDSNQGQDQNTSDNSSQTESSDQANNDQAADSQ
ncbi:cell division protein FtsQ/DivIB [Streptococcus sobrinus]|uniref:Cell division protein DivIB n=6 Tax=Streptococcus sobrinus TaxID=1310 RepID=U2J2L5_9STRE|nr:FtsQ-type POTRA domain-containing protein [Streptococcus sobrinus]ERJ73985.1 cell division protein FtsQ [Streptococcus sobrinus W1703]RKW10958.1 MAG: FtsQ-type POTRA domain-containing protein [Catonella sp.]